MKAAERDPITHFKERLIRKVYSSLVTLFGIVRTSQENAVHRVFESR